jgi:hypothetical protein
VGGGGRGGSQKVHKVIPWDLIMTAPFIYTVKKVLDFPVPSRDVTYHTLPGREQFNYSCSARVWYVTSRLGAGKSITFLQCTHTPVPQSQVYQSCQGVSFTANSGQAVMQRCPVVPFSGAAVMPRCPSPQNSGQAVMLRCSVWFLSLVQHSCQVVLSLQLLCTSG